MANHLKSYPKLYHALIFQIGAALIPSEINRLLRRFQHKPNADRITLVHIGLSRYHIPLFENSDLILQVSLDQPFALESL